MNTYYQKWTIRWLCWRRRSWGAPDIHDKFEYPYWLGKSEDLEEGWSTWTLVNGERKRHRLVASVKLVWDKETMTLGDIKVEKRYRKRALGSLLLTRVKDFALTMGVSEIIGEVTERDQRRHGNLLSWYQVHGFEVMKNEEEGRYIAKIRFAIES